MGRRCCAWRSRLTDGMLQSAREGRLLRLTLNRPEKRNALNLELCGELVEAIEAADADAGVGAILLSGNGKAFCAGMDLSEMTTVDSRALGEMHERLFTIGARISKEERISKHSLLPTTYICRTPGKPRSPQRAMRSGQTVTPLTTTPFSA